MNITLNTEISNTEIRNFGDLEREIFDIALGVGQQLMRQVLEKLDDELLADRDVSRYRNKGFQQTCIKTKLGAVEYKRRVYVDNAAPESARCVHLLDEALDIDKVGLVSSEVCQIAATAVCETSYRGAAELISETTGLDISAQGVWDIIQRLGESQVSLVQRHAELAQLHKGTGALVTKLLYEENDGIWLKLQGKSRQEHGPSKEMKVGNVFTLVGNRMKGRRACRSEKGANNLAVLLCQRHTVGFENLFAALPSLPRKEPEFVDTLPLYSADKIPKREGKGYEWQDRLTISGTTGWLSRFLKDISKSNNF